jgi:type IV pilus assembly protein PilB
MADSNSTALAALLISRGLVSVQELDAARALQAERGLRLEDALVELGFLSAADVARLLAEIHGTEYLDLDSIAIGQAVLEAIPESIARENVVLPVSATPQLLRVATWDPGDWDTLQKLVFILNRAIQPVVSTREQIIGAIDRHYGKPNA